MRKEELVKELECLINNRNECRAVAEWAIARETAMLESLIKEISALKIVREDIDTDGWDNQGDIADEYSARGNVWGKNAMVDSALSIIQRRKGGK
jgi:hypothetical protein